MKPERLATLPTYGRALDSETYRLEDGLGAPPIVVWSLGWSDEQGWNIAGKLLTKREGLDRFLEICDSDDLVLVGANIAFDIVCAAQYAATLGMDIIPQIRKLLEEGRVFDVQHAEALDAIARGWFGEDPLTRQELTNPDTGKRGWYSLYNCVRLVLGREDAKENDEWRLRYGELDDIPIEEWPETARQYPVDDACNTFETALAQAGHIVKLKYEHTPVDVDGAPVCADCGNMPQHGTVCRAKLPHMNMMDLAFQARAAVALQFAGVHGYKVDQSKVDVIEKHAKLARERGKAQFVACGILREDGSENQSALKRKVAIAYGCTENCTVCGGGGKVTSPTAKPIRCKTCKNGQGKKYEGMRENCPECRGAGMLVYANKQNQINCCTAERVLNRETGEVEIIKHKTCDGTGLLFTEDVPRTDKDGVGTGRDTLYESADEDLMAYAAYCEDDKVLDNYCEYLRRARRCLGCGAHANKKDPHKEGCPAPGYYGIPLNLGYNVMVETRRVSARGSIHQFPRKSGYFDEEFNEYVPSLRECIVPRCDTEIVEVPMGYIPKKGEEILPW